MPHVTITEERITASRISGGRGDMLLRVDREAGTYEDRDPPAEHLPVELLPVEHLEGRVDEASDAIVRAVVATLFRRREDLGRPLRIGYASDATGEALRRVAKTIAEDIFAATERAKAASKRTVGPDNRDPAAYHAMGESWEVTRTEGGFVLSFVSGEHGGPERSVTISEQEADRLRADPAAIEDVLRDHGTG